MTLSKNLSLKFHGSLHRFVTLKRTMLTEVPVSTLHGFNVINRAIVNTLSRQCRDYQHAVFTVLT